MARGRQTDSWTEDEAIDFFNEAARLVEEDESIIHLSHLASHMYYYKGLDEYLIDKFPNNESFRSIKKHIKEILKSRLIDKGYEKGAAMSIFLLKNNHGFKDKQEVENKGEMNIVWKEEKTYETEQETDDRP